MKLSLRKRLAVVASVFVLSFSFLALSLPVNTEALSGSSFKAGNIIDDALFFDGDAMTAAQVQQFLDAKVPHCDTNGDKPYAGTTRRAYSAARGVSTPFTCLKDYRQDVPARNPEDSLCNGISAGSNRTAAQIIDQVARSCGVSQKVLLVLLQKEQSLVTDDWPWPIQYRSATGYGCPDTAPCDSTHYGFFNQVYQAARVYKYYAKYPNSFNHLAGRNNNILYHPNAACGRSSVFIQNQATAGLYNYTPYQPNAAALNNLYGTGNSCSSYGNRNFWRMYNDWFGSTSASVLFRVAGSPTYYLEWSTFYYPIPSSEILQAYGFAHIAPREVSDFPSGKAKGPALERAAKFGSDDPNDPNFTAGVHIVDDGKRHGAPNWSTLSRHGFNGYKNYDPSLSSALKVGDTLRPIVRKPNGAIYLIEDNKKRGFPDGATYSKLKGPNSDGNVQIYAEQALTNMSAAYIDSKASAAPMLLDGKFITANSRPGIYLYDKGEKLPLSASTYAAWGGKTDYSFSGTEIDQIANGDDAPILVKSGSGTQYLVSGGSKKTFDAATLEAWGFASEQFTEVSNDALSRLRSETKVPRLITNGSPGIYFVEGGQRHGIPSLRDFGRLGFKWDDVETVSSQTMSMLPRGADLYAPGSLLRRPNGAVYLLNDNYKAHGVTSNALFYRFGFSWNNVYNVTTKDLEGYELTPLVPLLKDNSNNKYYIAEGGVYRHIPNSAMAADQYDLLETPHTVVHPKVLETLRPGRELTRFLRGSGPTVYYIENGQKRPFSKESAFFAKGGTWAQVVDVSDAFLDEFPRGSKL